MSAAEVLIPRRSLSGSSDAPLLAAAGALAVKSKQSKKKAAVGLARKEIPCDVSFPNLNCCYLVKL